MAPLSSKYRKLMRLREKRRRLDKCIAHLERKLKGSKYRWSDCSYHRNRE